MPTLPQFESNMAGADSECVELLPEQHQVHDIFSVVLQEKLQGRSVTIIGILPPEHYRFKATNARQPPRNAVMLS